jgi:hypothetical protein
MKRVAGNTSISLLSLFLDSLLSVDSFYFSNIYEEKDSPTLNEVRSFDNHREESITETETGHFCNRLIVCIFALCLLWLTTLSNCVYLVNFLIVTPSFSSVQDHCLDFIDLIDKNEQSYRYCVNDQLEVCNENLNAAYAIESNRIVTHQRNNYEFQAAFNDKINNCSSEVSNLKSLFLQWISLDVNNTIPYYSTCSAEMKASVRNLIGDQSDKASSLQLSTKNFIETSNTQLSSVVDYSIELNSYNEMYIYNKTKALQLQTLQLLFRQSLNVDSLLLKERIQLENISSVMIDCLTFSPNSSHCPFPINAASLYLDASSYTDFIVNHIYHDIMDNIEVSINGFETMIDSARININKFYQSVMGIKGIMNWLLSSGLIPSTSYLCGKSSPNICDFTPDDWYLPVITEIEKIDFYPEMPKLDEFWTKLKPIADLQKVSFSSEWLKLQEQFSLGFSGLSVDIQGLDWGLKDYNPPSYRSPAPSPHSPSPSTNLTDLITQQKKASDKFQNSLFQAIYATNNQTKAISSKLSSSLNNSTLDSMQSNLLSKFSTLWMSFHMKGFNVDYLVSSFLTIQGIIFLFDYIYRIIQSIKLIAKFWNKGVVKLPIVSLLKPSDKKEMIFNSFYLSVISDFLIILPFLWIQLLCLIVFCIIIVTVIVSKFVSSFSSLSFLYLFFF